MHWSHLCSTLLLFCHKALQRYSKVSELRMTMCLYNDIEKKSLVWGWSNPGTDFPARQPMPHSSQCSRDIWTLSSLSLTLKWSGSWTWRSLKVPSNWPILCYCRRLLWKKITFFHPWFTNLTIISPFHLFRITAYISILKYWNLGIKKWNFNLLSAMENTLVFLVFYVQNHRGERHCSCICAVV